MNKNKKILVIGDKILDVFTYGTVTKLGPDAPYPIFVEENTTENWGGAGNVSKNLLSLGDPSVEIKFICNPKDIIKRRYVDKKSNYIIMRADANDRVDRITESQVTNLIADAEFETYDAIVISDYGKGFLDKRDIFRISKRATELGVPSFLDTKFLFGEWIQYVYAVKINETEWQYNLKNEVNPSVFCQNLIITTGEKGAVYKGEIFPAEKIEVIDLCGAGDSMLAGIVTNYLETKDLREAIRYGNKVSAVAVSRKGVVAVRKDDVKLV